MYNGQKNQAEQKPGGGAPPVMSPRISFSNNFIEAGGSHSGHGQMKGGGYREAPVSDFEFSVTGYSMMSADELFFKGRLLPLKESCTAAGRTTTTLRDELESGKDEDERAVSGEGFSARPPKNPTSWRGFLGLRKSKKAEKDVEKRTAACNNSNNHDEASKNSQGFVD